MTYIKLVITFPKEMVEQFKINQSPSKALIWNLIICNQILNGLSVVSFAFNILTYLQVTE
jgi:hypothetical protein